ncbi:MAG: hypothetical protein WAQ08_21440 [Aquabacterium sp.]|jgi:hypothetical protein|uniref:hypothetical protein n=1 Tax=Aquabacterium sp. TaxID=1872578 RepID=UPI003BAE75FC
MLNFIIRVGMALVGLAMLVETFMPPISEATKIDRHELVSRRDSDNRTSPLYRLHFFGSRIASCDVGVTAYDGTTDGDRITVRYTRLFKACTAIDKDGIKVYANQGWRWFYAAGAVFLLLAAFGALPSLEFEGRRIY